MNYIEVTFDITPYEEAVADAIAIVNAERTGRNYMK